jgi:hypothetical protein
MKKLELKHIKAYLDCNLIVETLDYQKDYVGVQFDRLCGLDQWSK